jgi:hypothetical protein
VSCLSFFILFYLLKFPLGDDLNISILICLSNFSINSNQLSMLGDTVLYKILCQETTESKCHCFSDKAYCCPILSLSELSNIGMSSYHLRLSPK